jgi:Domain of unknown function (DUF4157)
VPAARLNPSEREALGTLVSLLDHRRIRLYRSNATGWARGLRGLVLRLSRNRAVALGNRVFLPDYSEKHLPVLAHELTHCAQYQAWGFWRYFGRGFTAQLRDLLYRRGYVGSSPYHYILEQGKPFSAYGMEQQGQIVEDCFRGYPDALTISPFRPGPLA